MAASEPQASEVEKARLRYQWAMQWAMRVAILALIPVLLAVEAAPPAQRIVSLSPSLTAILVSLGARSTLVGVDEYSARQQPEVAELPTVGGLFTPSLEAVVALEPDVVVLVPSAQQRDLCKRLRGLGIEVLELANIDLEQLLASIETLGRLVKRPEAAAERVVAIRRAWQRAERAAAERRPIRAVLVLQREPLYLVGRGSFLHAMLSAAGADNAAAVFPDPYPRVALEWLIAAAPEVILDASEDPADAASYWSRWPSLPAVAAGRVVAVPASEVVLPGPRLDRGLRILSEALHRGEPTP
jgi:iron complex transport system substrate-binding protein